MPNTKKRLTTLNVQENIDPTEGSYIISGSGKWYDHFEKWAGNSFEIKHTPTPWHKIY